MHSNVIEENDSAWSDEWSVECHFGFDLLGRVVGVDEEQVNLSVFRNLLSQGVYRVLRIGP